MERRRPPDFAFKKKKKIDRENRKQIQNEVLIARLLTLFPGRWICFRLNSLCLIFSLLFVVLSGANCAWRWGKTGKKNRDFKNQKPQIIKPTFHFSISLGPYSPSSFPLRPINNKHDGRMKGKMKVRSPRKKRINAWEKGPTKERAVNIFTFSR